MSENNNSNSNDDSIINSTKSLSHSKKYLIFKLGKEKFGVELSSVKEVIGMIEITEVPKVPHFFKGLINIRGKIISVIDLRLKMGLPEVEYSPKKTSIIITDIQSIILGFIVDDIEEVASYQQEDHIEESIEVQGKISKEFIQGVAKAEGNKLILILNTNQILSSNELIIIKKKNSGN